MLCVMYCISEEDYYMLLNLKAQVQLCYKGDWLHEKIARPEE